MAGGRTAGDFDPGARTTNSLLVLRAGRVEARYDKRLLPTYDVFDEDRYFEPADHQLVWEHAGRRIGLTICEDIWTHQSIPTRGLYRASPVNELSTQKLDLVLNLSASPWHSTKENVRRTLVADLARACRCPAVYVNAVGGQDELLFDGRSLACDATGRLVAGLAAFREDLRVVDPAAPAADIAPTFEQHEMRDIYDALVLGVRDYAHKTGFKTALLGLSGGIDSALVAVIAAEALGPQNVIGVSLPSAISSQHSRDDAAALAKNLGIRYDTLAIADVVAAAEHTLAPLFAGRPRDIAEENIQARARGLLLMAVSNKFGDREIIPANTIAKAPSAELRPNQTDQDSLPPYDLLDAILKGYIEEGFGRRDLIARGFDATVVNDIARKVDLNEYKRKQAAPGLKITPLAFGVGRRIPIVQKYVS